MGLHQRGVHIAAIQQHPHPLVSGEPRREQYVLILAVQKVLQRSNTMSQPTRNPSLTFSMSQDLWSPNRCRPSRLYMYNCWRGSRGGCVC
jgi:hypothetical protein